MPLEPRPTDRVGLRLELTRADRDRLMVAAAKSGQSMAAHVRDVVVKYLDEVEPVGPEPAGKPKARGRAKAR